jgi:hypothetical protein
MSYHLTPVIMVIQNRQKITITVKDMVKGNSLHIVGGNID